MIDKQSIQTIAVLSAVGGVFYVVSGAHRVMGPVAFIGGLLAVGLLLGIAYIPFKLGTMLFGRIVDELYISLLLGREERAEKKIKNKHFYSNPEKAIEKLGVEPLCIFSEYGRCTRDFPKELNRLGLVHWVFIGNGEIIDFDYSLRVKSDGGRDLSIGHDEIFLSQDRKAALMIFVNRTSYGTEECYFLFERKIDGRFYNTKTTITNGRYHWSGELQDVAINDWVNTQLNGLQG